MSRVNHNQMKKLLDLLSEDGILVNGKVAYTTITKQIFWKRIAMQLNSVPGGGYKNAWKWCKMWADWKTKTKKKADIILRRKSCSLEYPTSSPSLSSLERRLLKIINYPLGDKEDALRIEMVAKVEAPEPTNNFHIEYLNEDYEELPAKDKSSEDEDKSDSYDGNTNKLSDGGDILKEETYIAQEESSDLERKVKLKEKRSKKKDVSLEEFKVRMSLKLEKERVQQRNEELRLRAIELKLKGEELRLKEIEMNKINYLTNIEEEKLKCFRDMSSSLKELVERAKSGNLRL